MAQIIESSLENRLQKLINIKEDFRFFHHPSFDDSKYEKEIIGEMPEIEDFKKKRDKIRTETNWNTVSPELRPCYESPLLNREQEQHLFRKMNYYKYKASILMDSIDLVSASSSQISKIERLLNNADSIRNLIADCNFRLSSQVIRGSNNICRDYGITQEILSSAYHDILKSINYFDWTKGIKFSTYATWVIKKNTSREIKNKIIHHERHVTLEDNHTKNIRFTNNDTDEEKNVLEIQNIIKNVLEAMVEDKKNDPRQVYVLKNYFGINCERLTLDQISKRIGVTKERVRQIKEKALKNMKTKILHTNPHYEED
jgi:RNA polymerase sigma factor (sigma-70 family)